MRKQKQKKRNLIRPQPSSTKRSSSIYNETVFLFGLSIPFTRDPLLGPSLTFAHYYFFTFSDFCICQSKSGFQASEFDPGGAES